MTITVTVSPICIAHQLHLPYESKCNRLHGHNYRIVVRISATALDANGMVCDFTKVKQAINLYDHSVIGRVFFPNGPDVHPDDEGVEEFNFGDFHFPEIEPSTAENFGAYLLEELSGLVSHLNPAAKVDWIRCYETESSEVICR